MFKKICNSIKKNIIHIINIILLNIIIFLFIYLIYNIYHEKNFIPVKQRINVSCYKINKDKYINKKNNIKIKKDTKQIVNYSRYKKQELKSIFNKKTIYGDVFIEDFYKYTLPCNIFIKGNLYVRNVGLLKFCGKFIVTGNIYLSDASFGAIPKNSKIGGNIIF